MKKTKQKHEKELEDEERQRMFKNDISKGMRSKELSSSTMWVVKVVEVH